MWRIGLVIPQVEGEKMAVVGREGEEGERAILQRETNWL